MAGVEPAAGHDAMELRVEEEELRPGVQDSGDGDLGPQAAAGDLRQGLGDRGEEEIVGHAGGGSEEVVEFGGDREDDMEVRDGQEIPLLGVHPAHGLQPLALGAMPIPTGVVGNLLMAALRARTPMVAQRGRAAVGDGPQDVVLSGAEPGELARVLAHDVGELHAARWARLDDHDERYGLGGTRLARSGSRSSGLWVSCRKVVATWV